MAAADRSVKHDWQHSELVLVDAELAAQARAALAVDEDPTQLAQVLSSRTRSHPAEGRSPTVETGASDALRRLTELSELEPIKSAKGATRVASVAFAGTAWALLVVVAVEVHLAHV